MALKKTKKNSKTSRITIIYFYMNSAWTNIFLDAPDVSGKRSSSMQTFCMVEAELILFNETWNSRLIIQLIMKELSL